MPWSQFKISDIEDLRQLVSAKEYACMNFSMAFRKKYFESSVCGKLFAGSGNIVLHRRRIDSLLDYAIMISQGGQLFPVSAGKESGNGFADIREGLSLLGSYTAGINTVMGEKDPVRKIMESCFPEIRHTEGKNTFSYHSMVLEPENFVQPAILENNIIIRPASPRDLESILPLQKSYEIEEVLPDPCMYSSSSSRQNLLSILNREISVVAVKDGEIIAKANTNGTGFVYSQIGGVYTVPRFRGMGIATATVSLLIDMIIKSGKQISLFVKTGNHAAIRVYLKLGFRQVCEFQITYFL